MDGLGRGIEDSCLLDNSSALLAEPQSATRWVELDFDGVLTPKLERAFHAAVLFDRVGGGVTVVRDAIDSLPVEVD